MKLLLSLTWAMTAFHSSFVSSWSFASSTPRGLGKKSTSLDVLEELNRSNRLASYVPKQTAEPSTSSSSTAGHTDDGVALVSGGNSGIGVVTVKTLAMTGMKVILCARNVESARKVVQDSVPAWCRDAVTIQKLDLADMDSIQQASRDIVQQFPKLDVMVHNAGVMALPTRTETKQGLELQFGTNHVGHFMLTRLLLPHLNPSGSVVTVASTAHQMAGTISEWDAFLKEPNQYSAWGAYGQSKLANVVSAKGLQDRLNECGRGDIKSVSLHPGVIRTNLWRHSNKLLQPLTRLFADKTEDQGAATSVYCALVSDVEGGAYYKDCAVEAPTKTAQDESLRQKLWDYTEDIIADQGYVLPKYVMGKTENEPAAVESS